MRKSVSSDFSSIHTSMPIMFFFSFPSDNRKPEAHFTSLLEHLRYTRKKRKKKQDYETTVPCTTSSSSSSICSCLCDVNNLKLEVQVKQVTPPAHSFSRLAAKGRKGKGTWSFALKNQNVCASRHFSHLFITSSHDLRYLLPRRLGASGSEESSIHR